MTRGRLDSRLNVMGMLGLAVAAMLAGCAGDDEPEACRQSTGERVMTGSGGNPARIGPAIVASLIFDAVCADEEPEYFYFSCSTLDMAHVYKSDPPVDQELFSASPPKVGTWCTYADKSKPRYTTHPMLGDALSERPSKAEIANTTALFASEVRVPEEYVGDLDALQKFAEQWIDNGLGAKIDGNRMTVDMTRQDRFKTLSQTVSIDSRMDAECVRYEYSMEERDNPIIENKILLLHDFGMLCRIPSENNKLIIATLSERHVKGKQIDPESFSKFKTEVAEPFFDSVELKSAPSS
jgi:hypothetical protein